jgi:hypothetical protein
MDPFMGIVGGVLVAPWSIDLIRVASSVLLDHHGPEAIRNKVIDTVESFDGDRVTDFHMWSIGAGIYAASFSVVTNLNKTAEDILPHVVNRGGYLRSFVFCCHEPQQDRRGYPQVDPKRYGYRSYHDRITEMQQPIRLRLT